MSHAQAGPEALVGGVVNSQPVVSEKKPRPAADGVVGLQADGGVRADLDGPVVPPRGRLEGSSHHPEGEVLLAVVVVVVAGPVGDGGPQVVGRVRVAENEDAPGHALAQVVSDHGAFEEKQVEAARERLVSEGGQVLTDPDSEGSVSLPPNERARRKQRASEGQPVSEVPEQPALKGHPAASQQKVPVRVGVLGERAELRVDFRSDPQLVILVHGLDFQAVFVADVEWRSGVLRSVGGATFFLAIRFLESFVLPLGEDPLFLDQIQQPGGMGDLGPRGDGQEECGNQDSRREKAAGPRVFTVHREVDRAGAGPPLSASRVQTFIFLSAGCRKLPNYTICPSNGSLSGN